MRSCPSLSLLPALLVAVAGCQLCGLELPRCNPPLDSDRACGPDDYCSDDGFCRPVPRAPVSGVCTGRDEEIGERRLHLSFGTAGAVAMGDKLLGVDPVLSCGSDLIACGLEALGPLNDDVLVPVTPRAGDDPESTAALDSVAFRSAGPPLDVADGFALEVIFRAPSVPVATPIVAMSNGLTGWELGTDSSGYLGLAIGGQVLALSVPTLRTWHHALCVVNTPSLLALGDDDDILCVLDGTLLQTRFTGSGASPLFDGPLSVGSYDDGAPVADAAVAVLRLWPGDALAALPTSSARQDALVDEANARLARFHGITIDAPESTDAPATLRIAGLGFDFVWFNVKLQPLVRGGITHYQVVPTRWPRTAVEDGHVGLLVETNVEDLTDPAAAPLACYSPAPVGVPASGPDGIPGACDFASSTTRGGTVRAETSFVPRRDDLIFSVFLGRSAAASITIDDTTCIVAGGVLDDGQRGTGDCALVPNFADGFSRLIAHAVKPPVGAIYQATFTGIVWSPQIEIGAAATTPFTVLVADGGGFAPSVLRFLDLISLERIGLTRGVSTSVTTTVLPLGNPNVGSVILSESTDFIRNLILSLEETDPGMVAGRGTLRDVATVEMQTDAVPYDDQIPLTFGVDLGTPVERCGEERCNAGVGAGNLESPGQWEVLKVRGAGAPFVLTDVDVRTRGTPPLEIAFELHPEVAPTGCLLGRHPDISLVGCGAGACTEGTTSRVVWEGTVEETVPGPGLSDLAVVGSLAAEHLEIAADALYFEVRFLPSGDGSVFVLEDEDGPFLSLLVADGTLALQQRGAEQPTPLQVVNPNPLGEDDVLIPYSVVDGTWVQASCWVGPETACVTNMSYLLLSAGPPVETVITRARAGEAAAAVAFARVWTQAADTALVDIVRLTAERIATSFGLGMAARRSPTLVVEQRLADTTLQHDGGTFTIGPAWPRVELVGDAPAYVSDVDAGERLGLAVAVDLVGEKRGILEVVLATLPEPDGQFIVALDASDRSGAEPYEDYVVFLLTSEAAVLSRLVDTDADGPDAPIDDTWTFEGVQSREVNISWRGGVVTAEADDGAVAVREVIQFPLFDFVNSALLGSARADGIDAPRSTALRHIRISSR